MSLLICNILTQSLLRTTIMSHSRPDHATLCCHCAACAADKSLLYVRRHWTGCSCHRRFFTLLAKTELLHWFTGEYRHYFLPQNRPSPFHFSHPSLPSLCPLLELQFLSWVCLTRPWQQKCGTASSISFLFCFLILSLSVLRRATGVEWMVPWQHWQLKTCICLSCTLSVCFSLFFSFSRWMSDRQGCQGSRWPQEWERKKSVEEKIKQYRGRPV